MSRVTCERLKAIIPERTCIARQKLIEKGHNWITNAKAIFVENCAGCPSGEALYKPKIRRKIKVSHKTCVRCGNRKKISGFTTRRKNKDGHRDTCTACLARGYREAAEAEERV